MSTSADELINDYLDRLEAELASFPPSRRRELVQEISAHIAEARASLELEDEVSVRNLLDRIGDPAEIAAEAGAAPAPEPAEAPEPVAVPAQVVERRSRTLDVAALVLLLIGGLVLPAIGWLVGVVLLWISSAWTARQKVLGTLVVPGGLALPVALLVFATSSESVCYQQPIPGARDQTVCSSGGSSGQLVGTILVALLGAASIATVVYLGRRMGRNGAAPAV
ncbi:MAG TPA: hypothetical protein VH281_07635 [Gaiellaceae bacterium]|jgi:uncharacterized membrane protein